VPRRNAATATTPTFAFRSRWRRSSASATTARGRGSRRTRTAATPSRKTFRLGGDYNVLPDQLAVRAGGFFETQAADSVYQNIDFDAALRFGVALGGTYRVHLGDRTLDLMLAYGHVFFGSLDNSSPNAKGVSALAGTPCSMGLDPLGTTTGTCATTGTQKYRTDWAANLGTITSSINVINVGASLAF
jgi:hypothetical protein